MEKTITGLTIFAACYAFFYVLTPIWRRGWLPAWARYPRGLIAWILVLSLAGPIWGFGGALGDFLAFPSTSTLFSMGYYMVLLLLGGLLYSNPEAINFDSVMPHIAASLRFEPVRWMKENVFAGAEQKEIESIYKEQTGRNLQFNPLRAIRQAQTVQDAERDLAAGRKERQDKAGAEDLATLASGQPADITDVLRLFTMHRAPHPRIEQTFRVVIDPTVRTCHMETLFSGFRLGSVRTPDARFRFNQELVDLLQVFTSQTWLERFRPFFDTMVLTCHMDVRDSFDLPERKEFLRVTIALSHLDQHKGKIFIATELGRLGTMKWLEGEST
jgi:hypothetical protein